MAPGPGHDVDAFRAGHPPVDDRDVVLVPAELVDGVVTPIDGIDLIAVVLEAQDDDLLQPGVVLGNEHAHVLLRPFEPRPAHRNRLTTGATSARLGPGAFRLRDGPSLAPGHVPLRVSRRSCGPADVIGSPPPR